MEINGNKRKDFSPKTQLNPTKPTQQKIADLVRQSHEARKKAKKLLEQVKQKVEKLIGK